MKTIEEQRKEAEENYASRGCDGDCALCPEICHKSSDRMAFHAGWDAALKALIRCDDPKNCDANDIIDSKEFRRAWGAFVKYLFKWHDPKVEFPETDVEVLVKIDTLHNKYDIMKHNQYGWWQKAPGGGWCAPNNAPIGWRYIHEL